MVAGIAPTLSGTSDMTVRREFLAQLGTLMVTSSLDGGKLNGMNLDGASGQERGEAPEWDLSWLDRINAAKNRVVFNSRKVDDGGVVYSAEIVLNQFHEVYNAPDAATCAVIVLRAEALALGFNDSIWQRYTVGEQVKINDPVTGTASTRNIYWKPRDGANAKAAGHSISELQKRGLIILICNRALKGWANEFAGKTKQTEDEVYADMRANVIPGSYVVPSGIFALVRSQNSGCAYMAVD